MIGLDDKIKSSVDFSQPIPDGTYQVEVESISAWKSVNIKNAKVKGRTPEGKIVKGSFVEVSELEFWSSDIVYKIVEGEQKGRKIWSNLSTHPDRAWHISRFAYATSQFDVVARDLPTTSIGELLEIEIASVPYSYKKTVADPETGLDEEIEKSGFRVYINNYNKPSQDLGL